eukprot:753314-Hanusia_phi.AAC.2
MDATDVGKNKKTAESLLKKYAGKSSQTLSSSSAPTGYLMRCCAIELFKRVTVKGLYTPYHIDENAWKDLNASTDADAPGAVARLKDEFEHSIFGIGSPKKSSVSSLPSPLDIISAALGASSGPGQSGQAGGGGQSRGGGNAGASSQSQVGGSGDSGNGGSGEFASCWYLGCLMLVKTEMEGRAVSRRRTQLTRTPTPGGTTATCCRSSVRTTPCRV